MMDHDLMDRLSDLREGQMAQVRLSPADKRAVWEGMQARTRFARPPHTRSPRAWWLAGFAAFAVLAVAVGTLTTPGHPTSHRGLNGPNPVARVDGMTIYRIGQGQSVLGPPNVVWSPTGTRFSFTVNAKEGTAVIGMTAPLRSRQVHLGPGRTIVALTSHGAIVTSWSARRDWLYPVHGLSLGHPVRWTAPTDTWQEWVSTDQGPAIVTDGYKSGSVSLTWAGGRTLSLHGGEVYPSPDGRLAAVVWGTRPVRRVHPIGDVEEPFEFQPSPTTKPITVWDFGGPAPHRLATIRLPRIRFPQASGPTDVGGILFSPDGRYVAISVQAENSAGPRLIGRTLIFATRTGRLVGTAPYGNGMAWTPDSQDLWLGTAWAQGSGHDRIVNVEGRTVWRWPDSMTTQAVMPMAASTVLAAGVSEPSHQQNGIWLDREKMAPRLLLPLRRGQGGPVAVMAPGGLAAVLELTAGGGVYYLTWRP